ncbi:MAG: hypothetical protein F9B45_13340 [Phycisphaera sp. RhM]|nr:hypothetical protein [Phycisphaera sp. RhM]
MTSRPRGGVWPVLGGLGGALCFAFFTTLLLLVNGTATLVLLGVLVDSDPSWADRKGLMQFGLFALPLAMLVAEWLVWDFLCGLLRRGTADDDRGSGMAD